MARFTARERDPLHPKEGWSSPGGVTMVRAPSKTIRALRASVLLLASGAQHLPIADTTQPFGCVHPSQLGGGRDPRRRHRPDRGLRARPAGADRRGARRRHHRGLPGPGSRRSSSAGRSRSHTPSRCATPSPGCRTAPLLNDRIGQALARSPDGGAVRAPRRRPGRIQGRQRRARSRGGEPGAAHHRAAPRIGRPRHGHGRASAATSSSSSRSAPRPTRRQRPSSVGCGKALRRPYGVDGGLHRDRRVDRVGAVPQDGLSPVT